MNKFLLVTNSFNLFGLNISFYGLIIALAMIVAIAVACYICKIKGYSTELPIDLALFALPCAIIGARVYYCLFNGIESFIELFEIWNGGLAIYGGIIGGFLGVLLCCLIKKISLVDACDLAAPCLILGQSIGRIGCYFAGCCYGIETSNNFFCRFPLSVQINGAWHLATFFYESCFNLLGFLLLIILTKKTQKRGVITSLYLIVYGAIRAFLETFRDPSECLTIASSNLKVSQILSIALILFGIIFLIVSLKHKSNSKNNNDFKSKNIGGN